MRRQFAPPAPSAFSSVRLQSLFPLALAIVFLGAPAPARAAKSVDAAPEGGGLATGTACAAFGLVSPVGITGCEVFPEDGTIGVELVDRRGTRFFCGINGGCGASSITRRRPASRPGHLFVGATHTAQPGARLLPLWGKEERSLLQVLAQAIADSLSDAQADYLLKGASSGDLADPGGLGLIRLLGGIERRRRMLTAVSEGEVAPAPDAFAYFGMAGAPTVRRIELDQSGRLRSIAVCDTGGRHIVVSAEWANPRQGVAAWDVDLDGTGRDDPRVPLWGYEERYLLTVLSTALRMSSGSAPAGAGQASPAESRADTRALKVALRTVQERKDDIRARDRYR